MMAAVVSTRMRAATPSDAIANVSHEFCSGVISETGPAAIGTGVGDGVAVPPPPPPAAVSPGAGVAPVSKELEAPGDSPVGGSLTPGAGDPPPPAQTVTVAPAVVTFRAAP